jgi:hypothetical protein
MSFAGMAQQVKHEAPKNDMFELFSCEFDDPIEKDGGSGTPKFG